jgi:hypothetical protein
VIDRLQNVGTNPVNDNHIPVYIGPKSKAVYFTLKDHLGDENL